MLFPPVFFLLEEDNNLDIFGRHFDGSVELNDLGP